MNGGERESHVSQCCSYKHSGMKSDDTTYDEMRITHEQEQKTKEATLNTSRDNSQNGDEHAQTDFSRDDNTTKEEERSTNERPFVEARRRNRERTQRMRRRNKRHHDKENKIELHIKVVPVVQVDVLNHDEQADALTQLRRLHENAAQPQEQPHIQKVSEDNGYILMGVPELYVTPPFSVDRPSHTEAHIPEDSAQHTQGDKNIYEETEDLYKLTAQKHLTPQEKEILRRAKSLIVGAVAKSLSEQQSGQKPHARLKEQDEHSIDLNKTVYSGKRQRSGSIGAIGQHIGHPISEARRVQMAHMSIKQRAKHTHDDAEDNTSQSTKSEQRDGHVLDKCVYDDDFKESILSNPDKLELMQHLLFDAAQTEAESFTYDELVKDVGAKKPPYLYEDNHIGMNLNTLAFDADDMRSGVDIISVRHAN